MLFSKEKAELLNKIEGLEASLAEVNASLTTANADLVTLREQLAAAAAEKVTLQAEHETALAAKENELTERVSKGVVEAMAAIGVPESQLPARSGGPAANDFDAQITEINEQIAATTDPMEKGRLASKVIELMNAKAKAAQN
jgi:chromosome segregation ATPase